MKILLILQFVLIASFSFSQIAVGQWRDHLPYSKAIDVTDDGDDRIYCSTESAIFYYNKSDLSLSKLSKVNGLSDVGIKCISFNISQNTLFVGYHNGNIDLIKAGKSINISDIKRKQMLGSKSINNVLFVDKLAYISTGFGIIVLDIEKEEIKDTYYIGPLGKKINVNEITTDGKLLFAATEQGIYKANIDEPFLTNYEKWTLITEIPNFQSNFNVIAYLSGNIYFNFDSEVSKADTVYKYNIINKTWSYFDKSRTYTTYSISTFTNRVMVAGENLIHMHDSLGNSLYAITNLNLEKTTDVRRAKFDKNGNLWLADFNNGLVEKLTGDSFQNFYPNGPNTANVVRMDIANSILWSTVGSISGSWSGNYTHAEMDRFENQTWNTQSWDDTFKSLYDIMRIKISPSNSKKVYFGSWGYGLIEFYDNKYITTYNEKNSTLQTIFPGPYCRIGGLAFDKDENLWITNSSVLNPISVKTKDDEWISFNYGTILNTSLTISDIIVTKNNHKWVLLTRSGGLFAFDDKGTYEDLTDDDMKKFSIVDENNELITNDVFSIAEDLNGVIWIGTNMGILAYYYPENVFSENNFYASRIVIPSDIPGQANYLLKNETVTAIVVDGANRKWIGTDKSGVFLMSEDMSYEIAHFTTENSNLISDNITTIAMDNFTGEVFFGTDKGIVSYKGTATEGTENNEHVYVFPNPVKEDYSGLISITGLVTNSNVKITDMSGNLVYETTAEGGQANWNGKNFAGTRVQTGVYLVFSTNDDGTKTNITKILFVN